uniref:Uncharacterized protein n=1 Tax=Panagrolaimus sp. ES5 TaxID=591445 RepID=A0AC34GCQ8_9BILA
SIDWSPFSKCKDIVAVSAAGWIFFYDITEGAEAKDALNDLSWESAPCSAKWISTETIAVGFASKIIIFYDVNTKERLFEDNTARAVGTMVATQPVLFPGAFSYDSVRVITDTNILQQYAGVYQTVNRETQTGLVVPLPNKHIGQVFSLSVCETSGIIGTVGCDGRLLESLNGRVTCRNVENDFACFAYRPTLQLVRHKIDKEHQILKTDFELSLASTEMKEDPEAVDTVCCEPNIAHDKVVSSNWLEIRVGDATLIDQEPGSKGYSSVYVEKVTFDRRLESLTRLEFSKLTPGLAITGGEAGIVFIIPTSL